MKRFGLVWFGFYTEVSIQFGSRIYVLLREYPPYFLEITPFVLHSNYEIYMAIAAFPISRFSACIPFPLCRFLFFTFNLLHAKTLFSRVKKKKKKKKKVFLKIKLKKKLNKF